MTIPVECPHCDSVFQLSPDLAGKSMRCPNPDCREVFQVRPAAAAAPPAVPDPAATVEMPRPAAIPGTETQLATMAEFDADGPPAIIAPPGLMQTAMELPFERVESDRIGPMTVVPESAAEPSVFELPAPDASVYELPSAEPPLEEEPPPFAVPAPPARKKPSPKDVPFAAYAPKFPTAAPRPAAPLPTATPLGPKQVAWTADPPPTALPVAVSLDESLPVAEDIDDGVFERKPKKRVWPMFAVAALLFGVLGAVGFIGLGAINITQKNEAQLAEEAKEAYTEGKFTAAAEKYRDAAKRFPESKNLDEYRFLAALADARALADSVSAREDPSGPEKKLAEFLAEFGTSPYAQPDITHGADVAALGRKVADTLADHGTDRVAKFKADRSKMEYLEAAERTTVNGPKLLASLEKYRGKDAPGFDDTRKKFGDVAEAARKERDRLAILAPFRGLAEDPTDEAIEACESTLRRTGLANDAEAKEIVVKAKEALRKLIGAVADLRQAVRPPADLTPPILFAAAPLGTPEPRPAPDAVPDAVFAVARGVLYALDADTGRPLWGTRVAGMTADPRATDVPVRVTVSDGGPEWVLVASEVDGRRGISARVARTGEAVWYQPLDAPLAGRPVVVGRRAYVPLADPLGTVLEIQLSTGTKIGHLSIRQPVGAGLAALPGLQSGSGFLFVPADARRVFVFEVGREADDGSREPPRLVLVVATDHPRDSLRGEPILVGPSAGDGPRYLILPQTEGPNAMKLRCFPLPPPAELAADVGPAAPVSEVTVPGWSWFPPVANGERVVAATDAGAVAVFGINQPGNADRPLFALPTPTPAGDIDAVNRSLVVAVDEDSAWVVVGGKLTRLRTAVDPVGGLRVIPGRKIEPLGEPVHRAQVRPSANLGVVVTRSDSAAGKATAFDLGTGQVRWQRQLGATPAATPVVRAGKPAILADEAGGVYTVPTAEPDAAVVADVLSPPVRDPSAKAQVVRSADGSSIWVLVPESADGGKRLRVRHVVEGVAKPDTTTGLPDLPAGPPVLFGDSLLLPLRDGAVYRYYPGGGLMKGPTWRAGANPEAVCYLAAAGPDEFLTTDGAEAETAVVGWKWAAAGKPEKRGGPWKTRGAVVAPPAVLSTGDRLRFAVADSGGAVRLFEPAKQDEHVSQRRGVEGGDIPPGPAGGRLDVLTVGGKQRLVYAANRRSVVCLDPDAADPVWVVRGLAADDGPEVVGWATHGERLLVTDQTARVAVIDFETGKRLPDLTVSVSGLAACEVLPVAADRGLLSLADGTAVILPLPAAKAK